MKSLKSILEASILADIDDQLEAGDEALKQQILEFIYENYNIEKELTISDKPNKDGKYEVSCNGSVIVNDFLMTSLTNNMFVWHKIKNSFICGRCRLLTSLEGAPQRVEGYFSCRDCSNLKSLEGAPAEIKYDFCCSDCHSLQTLKGAPKKVEGSFNCEYCKSLESLEGAPKEVGRVFKCSGCSNLTSLRGAPKKVDTFYCDDCKVKFTEDDVKKVSNVKDKIYC